MASTRSTTLEDRFIKLFRPTSLLHATSLARLLEYKLQRSMQPPQPSVEIEVQVPKDVASTIVQEELNVEPKQQADEKKVLLENEKKEDTKLNEAGIDTMTFSATKNEHASFATLISHIDFVILKIFNNMVEHQTFFVCRASESDSRLEASIQCQNRDLLTFQNLRSSFLQ